MNFNKSFYTIFLWLIWVKWATGKESHTFLKRHWLSYSGKFTDIFSSLMICFAPSKLHLAMVGWNQGRGFGFNANNGMPFFFQNEGFFRVTSMIIAVKHVHFYCLILSLFIQAQKKELLISFVWVRCCGSVCEFWAGISRSCGHLRRGLSAVTCCQSRVKSPHFPLLWMSFVLKVNGIASSIYCVLN